MSLRARLALVSLLLLPSCGGDDSNGGGDAPPVSGPATWAQWGQNPQHAGAADVVAQSPDRMLVERVVDPFVQQELASSGRNSLLVHYPVPLASGNDVFLMTKGGTYTSPDNWASQDWGWSRLHWNGDQLEDVWNYRSDWKPVPSGGVLRWEPVHQAALAGSFLYVPGAAGSVVKLNVNDGTVATRISPFGSDASVFITGPLAADGAGNIYYNALRLDLADPWRRNSLDAWLVKVATNDTATFVRYRDLVPNPPTGSNCLTTFTSEPLPWPPSPGATPPSGLCGQQRPGVNVAPALAPDGTIYTVSRTHFSSRYGYLVAVNPDLTPRWAASLRERFSDGCGVPESAGGVLPPNGVNGGCRPGAPLGVDPTTNRLGTGEVNDLSSSSPVVAPDGSVLYGAYSRYNYSRGHLMKFSSSGQFLVAYDFGWDTTPAVTGSAGSYAVVVKDNNYDGTGSYCNNGQFCAPSPLADRYFVTRLRGDNLTPEWQFENPNGDEWCINAPALDRNGDVFGIAEDGFLYAIAANGTLRKSLLLEQPLGAAYTPLAIDSQGRLYAQNAGHFFVAGR
jgi:hypothetical protein